MDTMQATSARQTIALVFKKAWSKYNAGERAGFGIVRAHELVKHGVCEYADPDRIPGVPRHTEATHDPQQLVGAGSDGEPASDNAPATGARRRRSPP